MPNEDEDGPLAPTHRGDLNASCITCAIAVAIAAAPASAKENCKPSKWGAADEIGSANLVTPERTKAALALVKLGKSHPLGMAIDANTAAFPPRRLNLHFMQPNQQGGTRLFGYHGS
jgi:hypothetical protein